jgi:hypothetical protein
METRSIDLGQASETRVSVTEGLDEGESIAVNAQEFAETLFSHNDSSVPAS